MKIKGTEESLSTPFKRHEVDEYERKRYRGLDQKLVHARERRIMEKILRRFEPDLSQTLDIPCGYGRFSDLLLKKGFTLISSDISLAMTERALERSIKTGLHFGIVADARKGLPFKERVFGLVVSMRFFHHIHNKKGREFILSEFSRVAGELAIISYYKKNFLHLLQRKFRRKIKRSRTRIRMISKREVVDEIEEAGFRVLKIFPLIRGLHSHHIAVLEKIKTSP
ncbi:class I SAM-dependent methyltransferase [Acidobacteriota bacterium]